MALISKASSPLKFIRFSQSSSTFYRRPHCPVAAKIGFTEIGTYGLACRCWNATSGKTIEIEEKQSKVSSRQKNDQALEKWTIKMLYDGECPLCMREVNMLRQRNEHYGTIKFVDISSRNYSPAENAGLDYKTAMGHIHAIEHDGTVITDVGAFRRLYEEVGLGWIYAITKFKLIEHVANVIYAIWAKYRLQITGRPSLQVLLKSKEEKAEMCNKEGNNCMK